jgi:hypothetical protein
LLPDEDHISVRKGFRLAQADVDPVGTAQVQQYETIISPLDPRVARREIRVLSQHNVAFATTYVDPIAADWEHAAVGSIALQNHELCKRAPCVRLRRHHGAGIGGLATGRVGRATELAKARVLLAGRTALPAWRKHDGRRDPNRRTNLRDWSPGINVQLVSARKTVVDAGRVVAPTAGANHDA